MCISLHPAFFAFRVVHHKLHLGLDDAQNEMVRLQLVESARAEQDQLEGKAKESEKIIYIRTDPAGNIKADKAKSKEKIDGAVATIMALDRAIRCGNDTSESVYDTRGLLVF